MSIRLKKSPKSGFAGTAKPANPLIFSEAGLGHSWPGRWPGRRPSSADPDPLGTPLSIREVASLIGCSTWTVRQTLMPRGLPYFRSGGGKLLFYKTQVIRWVVARQQKGDL